MKKFIVASVACALIASGVLYVAGIKVSRVAPLHYYSVPAVKIEKIKLEVVYFVPRDQTPDPRFADILKRALVQIQSFHTREFRGMSALRFSLYPVAVIGREPVAFYDGADTARGNTGAMARVFTETAARIYAPGGDLYHAAFSRRAEGELPIRVFAYQGIGAAGGTLSALVSYDYFTQTNHGATTLYHEILHNLGVPDAYDYDTDAPQSDDIMGAGRTKPLLETYVRDDIKKKMTE